MQLRRTVLVGHFVALATCCVSPDILGVANSVTGRIFETLYPLIEWVDTPCKFHVTDCCATRELMTTYRLLINYQAESAGNIGQGWKCLRTNHSEHFVNIRSSFITITFERYVRKEICRYLTKNVPRVFLTSYVVKIRLFARKFSRVSRTLHSSTKGRNQTFTTPCTRTGSECRGSSWKRG